MEFPLENSSPVHRFPHPKPAAIKPYWLWRLLGVLALLLQMDVANALSTACSTLNAKNGTTNYTARFGPAEFAAGETISVAFYDNGQNAGGSPTGGDIVNLRSHNITGATYLDYRSNVGSQSSHFATISSSQLATYGLYVQIRAGSYIGPVSIMCSGAISSDASLAMLATSAGTLAPTFSAATLSYAVAVDNATSSLTVRPTANDAGATISVAGSPVTSGSPSQTINLPVGTTSVSVVVTAADGTSTQSYTLNITRADAAPVAGNVSASVVANSSGNPIALAISGTTSSVAVASNASHGTAVASGTSITYTPASGYSGTDTFTYTASGAGGTSSPATVTVTVSPALVLTPPAGALTAGTVGTVYGQSFSASGGQTPYTYSATGMPPGLTLDGSTGQLAGTPGTGGVYTLGVQVTDALGASRSDSYQLTISAGPPVAGPVSATVAANTRNNAIAPNLSGGAASSVAIVQPPAHGQVQIANGNFAYTPTPGYAGADSFTYSAQNAAGTSVAATVTINVSSVPLVLTPTAGALTPGQVGVAWSQALSATGGVPPYRFSATGLPGSVTLDTATGVISGTPTTAGTYSITATVTDAASSSTTVNLSVQMAPPAATALTLSPAAGSLPAATFEVAYNQLFSATGGTAPYSFSATGLPAGLRLDPGNGRLTGTPLATGNLSFSVTVSDANGLQTTARYTLDVTSTAIAPGASDRRIALAAGQQLNLDLSAGASGGPFSSATLLDVPAPAMGTAQLNGLSLTFIAAKDATGTLTLRYTLSNPAGTSAPATLTLEFGARPDPVQNQEVAGTVSAQAQSASQFVQAQIGNFSNRLEQLHDMDGHRNAFNLRFSLDQSQPRRNDADDGMNLFQFQPLTMLEQTQAEQLQAQQASAARERSSPPQGDFSVWTGGYVDFGKSRSSSTKVDNRMTGISAGIDYRLSRELTLGLGLGLGKSRSEIGESSVSHGDSYSAAFYGSYHPSPLFIDALLGYARLTFDSDRYIRETDRYANGSRNGDQFFGSLSTGYEAKGDGWLVSPYARLDASTTLLRGYRESNGGAYNLEYADQRLNLLAGVGGVRGQYAIVLPWAQLHLRSRLEYSHSLENTGTARVGYVDAGDLAYSIKTEGIGQDTVSGLLGADVLWPSGLTTGMAYQGTRALGEDSRSDAVSVRVMYRF